MNNKTEPESTETHASIKLGIDAHAKWFYVARQVDGATPQPVQKMTFEGLLRFVGMQQRLAREVYTCYEAGAFGYCLHRRLEAKGVTNYVVQPQDRDERGKGVNNDRLDARALCQPLDRFTRGNRKAFSIVRVPSEDEERERAFTRQRQQLVRVRQRLQAMGRSLLASHGIHVTGKWWKGRTWSRINPHFPALRSGPPAASGATRPEVKGLGPANSRSVDDGNPGIALLVFHGEFPDSIIASLHNCGSIIVA